jgi:hypothetical protein
MLDTAAPTPTAQLAPPAGYPITADGWVTFQRTTLPGTRVVLLVQKRDGCTRTVQA